MLLIIFFTLFSFSSARSCLGVVGKYSFPGNASAICRAAPYVPEFLAFSQTGPVLAVGAQGATHITTLPIDDSDETIYFCLTLPKTMGVALFTSYSRAFVVQPNGSFFDFDLSMIISSGAMGAGVIDEAENLVWLTAQNSVYAFRLPFPRFKPSKVHVYPDTPSSVALDGPVVLAGGNATIWPWEGDPVVLPPGSGSVYMLSQSWAFAEGVIFWAGGNSTQKIATLPSGCNDGNGTAWAVTASDGNWVRVDLTGSGQIDYAQIGPAGLVHSCAVDVPHGLVALNLEGGGVIVAKDLCEK